MNHENECAQERTAAAAKRRRQCQQMLLRAIDAAGSHYCLDRVRLAVLLAAAATVDRITGTQQRKHVPQRNTLPAPRFATMSYDGP